ncbi:hypothetical protein EJ05DRAFT_473807 [Pseudovirgaria hyperparasitica]|uniref:Glycosyl transferase n=1 Tax=Pseudovirgaria hyperparasitica TaxID=470096 RepID=A0A6A6WI01_9PEZI|nr:uncharacterized protein EJ05DRAFT_473807 [Pseudovirgaria hyperparasitica]KAF2761277.1 hypothetical protein EJ05DRAFT_473807 [Pseudovirgaria hyperparasitica]
MLLNSPTATKFGGAFPKQIQRALPVGIAVVVLFFILSSAGFRGVSLENSLEENSHISKGFPRKIWQTWKADALNLEERDLGRARTWTTKNPSYRYELLTDDTDMYYVETHFGPEGFNRPDIVHMYRSITARIIKADLLRYLIMYAEGGVYTDIDVEAIRPLERFIPERYNVEDVDMIVGVEIDQPEFRQHPILGQKCQSFCQWTFVCKPRLPVMMKLVEHIMKWLNELSRKQNKSIGELELDFDEVITGTGPSAFTDAIIAEMTRKEGKVVGWDQFHGMSESKLVGGVLVLTVEAFAAGQGHSDSGNHDSRSALVKHRFHASGWPTTHPRYLHPVYGEVEHCNWNADCVKAWDEGTKNFESLPQEEKDKLIAEKKIKDEEDEKKRIKEEELSYAANAVLGLIGAGQVPLTPDSVSSPADAPAPEQGPPAAFPPSDPPAAFPPPQEQPAFPAPDASHQEAKLRKI